MDTFASGALAIEKVMIAFEKNAFLAEWTRLNPHWRGAQVADVLAELANHDALLELVEPMYDEHEADVDEPTLLGHATRAAYYAYGTRTVEDAWPYAEEWVNAVGAGWEPHG